MPTSSGLPPKCVTLCMLGCGFDRLGGRGLSDFPPTYLTGLTYILNDFLARDCDYWQPGETIPFIPESPTPRSTSTPQHLRSSVNQSDTTLVDMLQCFQSSMEQQLSSLNTSLTSITERMDSLEGRQKLLEEEIKVNTSLSSSSVSTPEPSAKSRRRVTPTSLQVYLQ